MQKDPYSILGVPQGAAKEEIDKAYKKLARKKHPDKGGSADEFAEIQAAYDILRDPQKKKAYDSRFDPQGGFTGSSSGGFSGDFGNFNDFDDILNSFFGNARRSTYRQSSTSYNVSPIVGENIEAKVNMTLEEAFKGVSLEIEYYKMSKCNTCDGIGINKASLQRCNHCGGRGAIQFLAFLRECSACNGTGKIASNCTNCRGHRLFKVKTEQKINIPAGVNQDQKLTFKSLGNEGVGAPNGHLIVVIHIAEHKKFRREDIDLYANHLVNVSIMVFGGKITVETIDNKVHELEVPQNSQPGTKLVLKNAGMPRYNTQTRGSMYVLLMPVIPNIRNISADELEAWEKIHRVQNNAEPKRRGFFF